MRAHMTRLHLQRFVQAKQSLPVTPLGTVLRAQHNQNVRRLLRGYLHPRDKVGPRLTGKRQHAESSAFDKGWRRGS